MINFGFFFGFCSFVCRATTKRHVSSCCCSWCCCVDILRLLHFELISFSPIKKLNVFFSLLYCLVIIHNRQRKRRRRVIIYTREFIYFYARNTVEGRKEGRKEGGDNGLLFLIFFTFIHAKCRHYKHCCCLLVTFSLKSASSDDEGCFPSEPTT
jgi:hypothetical protein